VRTLDIIISSSAEAQRSLLREAFEAGRAMGREEAAADLRAKISGLLGSDIAVVTATVTPATVSAAPPVGSDKRATSGSVKPTITRIIAEAAEAGLTTEDVVSTTGFKPNSVRGTLWALGNEGIAVKRNGRWFPVAGKNEAADVDNVSAASRVTDEVTPSSDAAHAA